MGLGNIKSFPPTRGEGSGGGIKMEPVCWAGIVGIVAIAAAIGGLFKGSCKSSSSSGCGSCNRSSKKESSTLQEGAAPGAGLDEKKERAIDDLIK